MPQTLAEIADAMLAEAERLVSEGKGDAAAAVAIAAARAWRAAAGLLTAGNYSPKIAAMATMDTEHRAAISKGRAGRKAGPLLKAAQARGFTNMKELAKACGVGASFLSQAVAGGKKMPPALAAKLLDLTGWEP